MNCPKCKGEVIEIRGNYYCSKCGQKVDLNEIKEELEGEMSEVKSGAIDIKDIEQSNLDKEAEPISEEVKEPEAPKEEPSIEPSSQDEASAHYGRQFIKDIKDTSSSPSPSSSPTPPPIPTPTPPPPPPLSSPSSSPPSDKPKVKIIPKSEPVIHIKKDTEIKKTAEEKISKPKTKKIAPSYHKIRILLIAVVLLNILILLGIIYLFVIK